MKPYVTRSIGKGMKIDMLDNLKFEAIVTVEH